MSEAGRDLDGDGAPMVHLQARAWLSNGMALSRLSAMASTGVLGERLGDNLFLPASLRHLWQMAA